MNNTLVEIKSISYLRLYLGKCHKLIPRITDNDKTPSWDGNVELYSSDELNKNDLIGTIPIQVKGHYSENITHEKYITFPISVIDLRNYLLSHGVMYFVIYCNDEEYEIYFISLLPYDLEKLLNKMNKTTVSVKLKRLTTYNSTQLYNLLREYLIHSNSQAKLDNKIEKDVSNGNFKGVEAFKIFSIPGNNSDSEIVKHMNNDFKYIYAQIKGTETDIVIGKYESLAINYEIAESIEVNGEILYKSIKKEIQCDGSVTIRIGNNISISNGVFNLHRSNLLKETVADLKYVQYLIQKGRLNNFDFEIEFIDRQLDVLLKLERLLYILGVNKDLLLDNITEKDIQFISYLEEAFLFGKTVPLSIDGGDGIGIVEICNIKLLICTLKAENAKFNLINIFEQGLYLEDIDTKSKFSPLLYCLSEKNLLTCDNVNLVFSVKSILGIRNDNKFDYLIYELIENLINAYDTSENNSFIEIAYELTEEMMKIYASNDNINLLLDYYQIKYRLGLLSEIDRREIVERKICCQDNRLLFMYSVLLSNYDEAAYYKDEIGVNDMPKSIMFLFNNQIV